MLFLATAAVPGSLLIAKLGVRGAVVAGLGMVALFGALRGVGPNTTVLFSATFLMGVGVAVCQPALPSLVREWFPTRIAIATAVFSNGVLIGETVPRSSSPSRCLPRVAKAGDVHRMSAAMFTFQYGMAFVVPLIAGALWDATGIAVLAFIPGVAAAAVMGWLSLPLRIPRPNGR